MPTLSNLVSTGGGFELIDSETFTSSGTWTKPAATQDSDFVVVDLWGGGGGGSAAATYGGGGGGGAHNRFIALASALSATETVTVGAGGAAGNPAGDGGTSSFGTYGSAYGGGGFAVANSRGAGGGGLLSAGICSALFYNDNGSGYQDERVSGGAPGAAVGLSDAPTLVGAMGSIWAGGSAGEIDASKHAVHGGGAGAYMVSGEAHVPGSSVWGGGGGAGNGGGGGNVSPAGTSYFGGDGGDAGTGTSGNATDGSVPGGGGGGCGASGTAGAGARGEVRVYVCRGGFPPGDISGFIFE